VLRVYVAAPYPCADKARAAHRELDAIGIQATSAWAEEARGQEQLSDAFCEDQRKLWERNAEMLADSHALLALSEPAGGGEFFVEIGMAIRSAIPVVWVGTRRVLSCYSGRVRVLGTLEDALVVLGRAARLETTDRTAIRREIMPSLR